MKRTSMKNKQLNLKLKRRLEVVRTTIRELTPAQLQEANGGNEEITLLCSIVWTCCGYTDS